MPLDQVWTYFKSYDKADFEVFAAGHDAPAEQDVQALEAEIGFPLPAEFREFSRSFLSGIYMAAREEHWPRPKAFDVGPFWSMCYGFYVLGIAKGVPDFMNQRLRLAEMREMGIHDLAPCLKIIGNPDILCFDRDGNIVTWRHEEPDAREVQQITFSELLMREVRELEDRLRRRRSEMGTGAGDKA